MFKETLAYRYTFISYLLLITLMKNMQFEITKVEDFYWHFEVEGIWIETNNFYVGSKLFTREQARKLNKVK